MKKVKKLIALLLAAVMLLAMFGCAAGTADTPAKETAAPAESSGAAEPAADGADEAPAGGETINFLCVNENYTQAMQDCIARWEEKTGNKVDVQLYPAEEYITVLSTQMMAGGSVDLFRGDGTKYAECEWPIDYFYDLSNEEWVSRLTDDVKALITFSDGTIRGLPYMSTSYFGMMYNKAIFEQAGITELPATWTEFLDCCEKIKTSTDAIPVNISTANGSEFCTTHLMHGLFNNVYLTRGVDGAKQLFADLDSNKVHYVDVPEYQTSLEQICELRDLGYITDDFISNTYDMAVERFGTGAVAMHPCADFILEPLLAGYPEIEENIGFFPIPYQDTKGSLSVCTGPGIHVANNAPHLEAALDFISYYASQENQELFNEATPGLNLFSDVPASDNAISKYYPEYADVSFTEIDEAGVLTWPEMDARSIIQEMMLGQKTPAEMLAKMDEAASITGKSLGIEGW